MKRFMPFTVRTATAADFDPILQMLFVAFHDVPDEELSDIDRQVFEPDRSLVAVDAGEIVGHTGTFSRELTVPGGVIPAGYVTMVGVASTHRRQGIASAILTKQLADIRERGEPAAVLWASEGRIYQRFGYGLGSRRTTLLADTREIRLNRPPAGGTIKAGRPDDFRKDLAAIYESVRRERPGYASRDEKWWDFLLSDPKVRRHGAGPLRVAVYSGSSGAESYALFRVRQDWETAGPTGEVMVRHLVASTPAGYLEMWRYLLNIDLTRKVSVDFAAVDEPVFDLVNEPRRLGAQLFDGLWLRIVDIPSALAARSYSGDDDVVLDVSDHLFPENNGRFRLDGSPTQDAADLSLDIATLSGLYLGGGSAGALAAAGRIEERRPGALAAAHRAFTWPVTPVGLEMF